MPNLPPALTPTEWAASTLTRDGVTLTWTQDELFLTVGRLEGMTLADLAPALMALANAVRDDGGRVTRMDADLLRYVRAVVSSARVGGLTDDDERQLGELADRLTSLLPPLPQAP